MVEDETGLKVSRMYMASVARCVVLEGSDCLDSPRSEAPEATKLGKMQVAAVVGLMQNPWQFELEYIAE